MRSLRIATIGIVLALLLAASATVALAATANVGVRKSGTRYSFTPSTLSIRRGDTVRWAWRGAVPHNVAGPGFKSRTANRLTFSRTFRSRGTFRVRCTIHASLGQRMTIRVR
jgi:plastocyanin